ncbi:hypothetical protein Zmor_001686 [Zophobas morio]|uniref:Uncharacterized protein n=1 Tax=Zophobas morio TaxID=2755281 RepID=A0AA38MT46_9CUCU|nr:hypothetical protein Zmor_001686 [Zophobas morio]
MGASVVQHLRDHGTFNLKLTIVAVIGQKEEVGFSQLVVHPTLKEYGHIHTMLTKYRWNETWPVKLRRKPVIRPPEMILDMPQFDSHLCHHVTDWSSQNCLATTKCTCGIQIQVVVERQLIQENTTLCLICTRWQQICCWFIS